MTKICICIYIKTYHCLHKNKNNIKLWFMHTINKSKYHNLALSKCLSSPVHHHPDRTEPELSQSVVLNKYALVFVAVLRFICMDIQHTHTHVRIVIAPQFHNKWINLYMFIYRRETRHREKESCAKEKKKNSKILRVISSLANVS